jgi:hypothetical protein
MTVNRVYCACQPDCAFLASPGSRFNISHDRTPERQPERSAEMTRRSRRGKAPPPDWSAYRDRPADLALDVFGISTWSRQRELVQAVADHDRVSVTKGHKTGGSTAVAILSWWFCLTRPNGRTVLMSNTHRQVRSVLWREVRALHRRALVPIPAEVNDVPERGVVFADGREILGFSTDTAEQAAGISGEELLFIYDEASGAPAPLIEVLLGSAAGDAKILLLGNPTKNAGPFYDSHHDSAHMWHRLHISSLESPNVVEGKRLIPGLATKRWADERREDWGEQNPLWYVRVLGLWPPQSLQAVMGMQAVDDGVGRFDPKAWTESSGPTVLGCDPARFGSDESVVFAVRGLATLPPYVFRGLDSIALAREVVRIALEVGRPGEVVTVNVDETGLGGGVVDQLRTMPDLQVNAINAGESPGNPQYQRRRDELWFGVASFLKQGGMLPNDRKLVGELVGVEYSFSPTGKIVVEPKEELRKRLGRSPDRADALALAVYRPACVGTADLWMKAYGLA